MDANRPRTATNRYLLRHRDIVLNGKKHKRRNGSVEMARASIVQQILLREGTSSVRKKGVKTSWFLLTGPVGKGSWEQRANERDRMKNGQYNTAMEIVMNSTCKTCYRDA
ncbi:hypothetical protein NPIL_349881 [Nephila pilipes]|uniref:Uncharacterized protein n=1 Tax=Nephila pilipes TaxID=299642 RepID=A0A8X6Q8D6_NEPPI|nr:hypothetical protein NPIL_349881 [Nephila pilipes]